MLERHQTRKIIPVPLVLAVNCSRAMIERCCEVIEPYGLLMRECDLVSLRTAAARYRPMAIVLNDELYTFDPDGLEMVAKDVGSMLVVARGPTEAAELLRRIVESARLKSHP